jgi:two-component system response regulator YesN
MHTVLLVDDEIFARKGLRNLIDWEASGFQVIEEADNGEDALELIQELKPDLVITDIRMPVLDGLGLIGKAAELGMDETSFIIISGYDDFKYAQQAVRYGVFDFILKPIDEIVLKETLDKLDLKLQQEQLARSQREQLHCGTIIKSLIKEEFNDAPIAQWANRLGVKRGSDLYYIFIEVNDIHPWQGSHYEMIQEKLQYQVKDTINGMAQADRVKYVHEHRNRLGFIYSADDLQFFQGQIGRFAKDLQRTLSEQFNQTFYIYVGKPVNDLLKLSISYKTAKDALQYKYINDEVKTVIYDDIHKLSLNYISMNNDLFQQLIEYIEEKSIQKINETIDSIFNDFKVRRYAPEAIKLTIHNIVSKVLEIMENMDNDKNKLQTLEPIVSWQDLNISFKELKGLFSAFIMESTELLNTHRKEFVTGGIQKIKSYIEEHYDENINLKSIAGKFYMNPVYLGQLFKKVYGVFFNEFLLQLRINEAKKLLRQTDMRIYEIAEKVGFTNADYFVTQFAKIEQMTPTEYRNKLLR